MFLVQLPVPGEPLPAGVRGLAPSPFPFRLARNLSLIHILMVRVSPVLAMTGLSLEPLTVMVTVCSDHAPCSSRT